MNRIKPHGPVSPQLMDHFYGAAKPAPASDDTALLRQAVNTMYEVQYAVAQAASTEDVELFQGAITALESALKQRAGETNE